MGGEGRWGMVVQPPTVAPLNSQRQEQHWTNFDDSVNALSFGFVAAAILISMFLLLAVFERILRQRSAPESAAPPPMNLEDHLVFRGKLLHQSHMITKYGRGVLVLMPGEQVPTFIAHPAPAASPSEPISSWPLHHHNNPCMIHINQ